MKSVVAHIESRYLVRSANEKSVVGEARTRAGFEGAKGSRWIPDAPCDILRDAVKAQIL